MSFNWTKYIRLADELLKGTDERIIGSILDELRKARNLADYNSGKFISKVDAERMVNSAKSILEILEILNDRLKNDGTKE